MKILHVGAFDAGGGAARAMMRLHDGLLLHGADSHVLTIKPTVDDPTVSTPLQTWQVAAALLKRHAAMKIVSLQKTPSNPVIHSLGFFSSGLGRWIESSNYDLVNLHWICAEALSIKEIARISKPIVWTLHDMWPISGAEHYDDLDYPARWKEPYTVANRPRNHRGPDIDRFVWTQKARLLANKNINIVSPSNWLARCVRDSALMGGQPCDVIFNPVNTAVYAPVDRRQARSILGLPLERRLILYGAMGATSDKRKGFDLLSEALLRFERAYCNEDVEVIVLGAGKSGRIPSLRLESHFVGSFHDDLSLRLLYSAADVFVAPSRQDNLPNMVVEAAVCGTQTAAFDIGGMSDIVIEGLTGRLAKPFDVDGLALAIQKCLTLPIPSGTVREVAARRFSMEAVIPSYLELYQRILGVRG